MWLFTYRGKCYIAVKADKECYEKKRYLVTGLY